MIGQNGRSLPYLKNFSTGSASTVSHKIWKILHSTTCGSPSRRRQLNWKLFSMLPPSFHQVPKLQTCIRDILLKYRLNIYMFTADIEKYLPPNPGQVIYTFYYLYFSILKLNITKSPSHYIFKHFLQVKKIKLLSNSTALIL